MHWSIQPSSREVTSLVRIIHRAKCSTAGLRSNSYTAKTHHSENCIAIATAIAIAMAASAALRRIMAQDPVLTACGVLSAIGLGAPLIVPPIRNALNRPEPVSPPKLADVVEGMTGKARN
ncbi:hypothetical protein M758_3G230700 [Ceratodon purpureus]|uniref:Uncharacterized protein n=1 Tax=Ceratodon purpureus TaxID=3225 RepID=A0A8T0ILR3_CERPU|nr:hypothetical protein KC19_3G229500 [Ceratodon purpureus]KAG0624198.1 hypothetical protein M758_3G230700 [Ceratodon purpureus]